MNQFWKFAVPVFTGLLGFVKLFDSKKPIVKVITTVLIVTGGVASFAVIDLNARSEKVRADKANLEKEAEVRYSQGLFDLLKKAEADHDSMQAILARLTEQMAGISPLSPARKSLASAKRHVLEAKKRLSLLPPLPPYRDTVEAAIDTPKVIGIIDSERTPAPIDTKKIVTADTEKTPAPFDTKRIVAVIDTGKTPAPFDTKKILVLPESGKAFIHPDLRKFLNSKLKTPVKPGP